MLTPERLDLTFKAIMPFFQKLPQDIVQFDISLFNIEGAFKELRTPLADTKKNGGLINPWNIAGLKRNEVRNTAALRGLWLTDFGGDTSCQFLAEYLSTSIPRVAWIHELKKGYRVDAEFCPVGDTSDRVDLVIQTANHLIGIEVKIDACLGPQQLERYFFAIEKRAKMNNREPHVILLAPFKSDLSGVISTSWQDIETAADLVTNLPQAKRNFIEHFIITFGKHVSHF